jgi:kinesin family protein 20
MRLTLVEQEQTQAEQDRVLEAKSEEADWLATGTEQLQLKASFS